MLETAKAFLTVLAHHLWWEYIQRSVLWEILSAVLLNPDPDKKCSWSTPFTIYLLRRHDPQLLDSLHSQALKPSGVFINLSANIKAHDVAFFLECFYLFPLYIKVMTYFLRKVDNNERITKVYWTVIVTRDLWILSMKCCTRMNLIFTQ